MDIQRVRNLTTGMLHTSMDHVYQDIEYFVDEQGIMTHQLPNAAKALRPYLRWHIQDERFWDGQYDNTHVGEVNIEPMSEAERTAFRERFRSLPSLFG